MTERTRKRGWMPVVLGISLALNLAVLAAVAGAAWRHKDAPQVSRGGGVYMQALPREAQRAVRAQLRSAALQRGDVSEMLSVLREDPFDPAAAAVVLEVRRDAGLARQNIATAAWLEQVSAMNAQDRSAYADRLEEVLQRRKARWQKRREAGE